MCRPSTAKGKNAVLIIAQIRKGVKLVYYTLCDGCEKPLYEGDKIFYSNGRQLCDECLKDEIDEMDISELAELLGIEEQRVHDPEEARL